MKTYLYLLRHTQSVENTVSKICESVDGYEYMKTSVREAFLDQDIEQHIKQGVWPSQEVRHIAHEVRRVIAQNLGDLPNADYDLSPLGIEQARAIGKNVQETITDIDVVFHSPYRRAVRTKVFLAEECHYYYGYRPHNGESSQDVIARVRPFLRVLFERYQGQKVFIVSHKVSIIAIMAVLEHKTSQERYGEFDTLEGGISNGGLTVYVLQCDGQILHKKLNQIYY